ncbi:MAG: Uncharacterised protein [Bacteroidota bacterium]|nr:MAG: Uncharacterised protein [Bacteroidota bacterium]
MNKVRLTSFVMLVVFGVYAQENNEDVTKVEVVNQYEEVEFFEKNEIRLNALDLIVHPALSISYERLVNESNGYGISLFANFGDNNTSYQNIALTPYYRFYFLNRKDFGASGIFVEAFSSFSTVDFDGDTNTDSGEFQFSMGVALGKKWVNRNGFTFELFAGVGRYFINRETDDSYHPEAHGRFGIAIGKRF